MSFPINALVVVSVLAIAGPASADEMNFRPWSDNLFVQFEKEFGEDAAQRLRNIHDLIVSNRDEPVEVKLRVANDTLNQLPWITDRDKYDEDDYWATPLETIATFGGDCEDMAIGKFMMLRLMGVPKENLRLTYVTIWTTGEAHMVLAYIDNPAAPMPEQSVLVLDNYETRILPAKERMDLKALYLVDADGRLALIDDDGRKRELKSEVLPKKFAKLDKVKARIEENRLQYQQYNDGRPLY